MKSTATSYLSTIAAHIRRFGFVGFALAATSYSYAKPPDILGQGDQRRQVESQVSRLVQAIKDEYAVEERNARYVRFVDVPNFGVIALGAFSIEGFGRGNNVHQYLAIFGPPNDKGTVSTGPYYALSGIVEVGDGCAIDVRRAKAFVRGDDVLRLRLPTHTTATTGYCEKHSFTYALKPAGSATLGWLVREK